MNTFTVVNEATLTEAVKSCQKRLVYIAPGVTESIVEAMSALMERAEPPAITVIVDADPEVCRLGYGTVEGLKRLQAMAAGRMVPIRYQPGLRLGVLISDEQISVYSPTPLLIEAGADREDQPNAIFLGPDPLTSVLRACAAEGEVDPSIPLPSHAEIGSQAATPELLQRSLKDLERLPPKPYDVARVERVYSSKLQYVDFEVTGYRLASRRIQIPTDLLVGSEKTLEARLRNSFSLLEGKDALVVQIPDADAATGEAKLDAAQKAVLVNYSEQAIEEERRQIYEDFLSTAPGYGQLISKTRRAAFDTRVAWFKARVEAYSKAVSEKLDAVVKTSIAELTEVLLPGVLQRPPARLLKHSLTGTPVDDDYRVAIRAELAKAFRAGEKFYQPVVKVIFKDLTYETIKDEKFRAMLEQMFQGLGERGLEDLFNEHDAAPEMKPPMSAGKAGPQ